MLARALVVGGLSAGLLLSGPAMAAHAAAPAAAPASSSVNTHVAPAGNLPGWRQTMRTNFTGSTLATGWGSYQGEPGGDPNGNWMHSHAVTYNGVLTLTGHQDAGHFTTGGVMDAVGPGSGQTYGKYEARVRMPKAHGIQYTLLLWPKSGVWPQGGEIDFAESDSSKSTTTATVHYGSDNSQIQQSTPVDFTHWNVLGVEWTPGKIVYTINGKPWGSVTGAAVPNDPMNLAIQSQADTCGGWSGATCPDASTPAHADLQIDWAVAYARS